MTRPRNAAAPAGEVRGGAIGQRSADDTDSTGYDAVSAVERACVGAAILAVDAIGVEMLSVLDDADLESPLCRIVFGAIRRMVAEGRPVDMLTVADYVDGRGLLDEHGWKRFVRTELWALGDACPVPINGVYYARIVARNSRCRVALASTERLAGLLRGGVDDDVVERVAVALSYAGVTR